MDQLSPFILCVDDEPDFLTYLSDELKSLGFPVTTASSADAALEIIRARGHQLLVVLSDYQMPEKSGFDLRKDMMPLHKNIPFILVSAFITKQMALSALDLKVSAFVDKPFEPNQLKDTILKESKDRLSALRDEAELIQGFVQDSESLLEEMEGLVLALEADPHDTVTIDRIFACAHTIKGTSGFFKPESIHKFTHRYEDFLSEIKKGKRTLTVASTSVLLSGLDTIKLLVNELKLGSTPTDVGPLLLNFEKAISDGDLPQSTVIKPTPSDRTRPTNSPSSGEKDEEIKVKVSLLDGFMERSGELTVLRNMINKVVRAVEREITGSKSVASLVDLLGELHKINAQMQEQVVELRKVPLKQIFKPLGRTIRDLNQSLKKQIELTLEGDELRIDHSIADILGKTLIHLVRNAADHGIESSEGRQKAGKPEKGKLKISTKLTREFAIVSVQDDGKGIDPKVIKTKAIEKGILTAEEASKLSDQELRHLIFAPGFSTAAEITDISGRGVGTDMVLKTVQSSGGRIEIESDVGKGTTFHLYLPLPKSVLIISSLLIQTGSMVFAIPQENLERILSLSDNLSSKRDLDLTSGAVFYRDPVDGLLPVISLQELITHSKYKPSYTKIPDSGSLIKVKGKTSCFCLLVDEILDIEDTVVKPLSPALRNIPLYSGATFLGDGLVGLILNVDGIARSIGCSESKFEEAARSSTKLRQGERGPTAVNPGTSPSGDSEATSFDEAYLIYETAGQQLCASPRNQLFRLEEMPPGNLRFSGGQPVIVYRGQTTPVYELATLVDGSKKQDPSHSSSHPLPMIIVLLQGRYVAFRVSQFCDLTVIPKDQIFPASNLRGQTICTWQDQSVRIVDLEQVLAQAKHSA